jgi:hypothetical protein
LLNEAIERAIVSKMPIAELEPLGIDERDTNALEKHAGVYLVEDLLDWSRDDLKLIPNIGDKSADKIINAVKSLHLLPQKAKAYHKKVVPNKEATHAIRAYGLESCQKNELVDIESVAKKDHKENHDREEWFGGAKPGQPRKRW